MVTESWFCPRERTCEELLLLQSSMFTPGTHRPKQPCRGIREDKYPKNPLPIEKERQCLCLLVGYWCCGTDVSATVGECLSTGQVELGQCSPSLLADHVSWKKLDTNSYSFSREAKPLGYDR